MRSLRLGLWYFAASIVVGGGLCTCGSTTRSADDAAMPNDGAGGDSDAVPDAAPPRLPNLKLSPDRYFNTEPFIAVDPTDARHLVAGWMHSQAMLTMDIQLSASFDGGRTWSEPATMPHFPGHPAAADISVAFDRGGVAHAVWVDFAAPEGAYTTMTSAAVVHSRAESGGLAWTAPNVIRRHDETSDWAVDRPWVVIDRSGGPRDGWLYVVNNSVHTNHDPPHFIHLKRSTDHGATWSADIRVDASPYLTGDAPVAPAVASVGPDGTVYVVYPSWHTSVCPGPWACLLAAVSTDGAMTFEYSTAVSALISKEPGTGKYVSFWAIAADTTRPGNAVVVWAGRTDGATQELDVFAARTEDAGRSWSPRARVTADPAAGIDEELPWIVSSPEGRMAVSWRGRRTVDAAEVFDVYFALSLDGGKTFSPQRRLSDQPSPWEKPPCCNAFLGLAISSDAVHGVWGDRRENPYWEVYYMREPLPGPPE